MIYSFILFVISDYANGKKYKIENCNRAAKQCTRDHFIGKFFQKNAKNPILFLVCFFAPQATLESVPCP